MDTNIKVLSVCEDCGVKLVPRVLMRVCYSSVGYYIGTACNCGPYSRESEYFFTEKEAEEALREFVRIKERKL